MSSTTSTYDVFLCHNSKDKPEVEAIGQQLRDAALNPWLDKWDLRPGFDWMDAIEEQIQSVRAVAVFVGDDDLGPWQQKEIKSFLRRQVRKELPVIPVILTTCTAEPELPSFLEDFTWVDFRGDRAEALHRLIWGITGEKRETVRKPTVLIAPALARKPRKTLIAYCRNTGIRVLGDGLYPDSSAELQAAFREDLKQSNLFVQVLCEDADRSAAFPKGKERWFVEAATEALTAARVLLWRPPEVDPHEADGDDHREFLSHPDVLDEPPNTFHDRVVTQTRQAFEIGAVPVPTAEKRIAMVKFSADDAGTTAELMLALKAENVMCVSSQNGIPIVDAYRAIPSLDAVIVVLGRCQSAWKEQRGLELVAIALRDDAPLRFYYRPDGKHGDPPPLSDPGAIDVDGRTQISRLVAEIRRRPRVEGGKS